MFLIAGPDPRSPRSKIHLKQRLFKTHAHFKEILSQDAYGATSVKKHTYAQYDMGFLWIMRGARNPKTESITFFAPR